MMIVSEKLFQNLWVYNQFLLKNSFDLIKKGVIQGKKL